MKYEVIDDDASEIFVKVGNLIVRSWMYHNDSERRIKMLCAREYVEGRFASDKQLEEVISVLMPRKPEDNPKDGPCCYELEDCDGVMLWIAQGCSCGNYDDAQSASSWAHAMNRYLEAAAKLKKLGIELPPKKDHHP